MDFQLTIQDLNSPRHAPGEDEAFRLTANVTCVSIWADTVLMNLEPGTSQFRDLRSPPAGDDGH